MLPEAQYQPARGGEVGRYLGIPLNVAPGLDVPEVRIGLGRYVVGGTAMPEAAVYEDRDLPPGERYVDATAAVIWYGPIDPVAQPSCVEEMAQLQFRPGVPATVGLHVSADCGGARPRQWPVFGLLRGRGDLQPGSRLSVHTSNVLWHGVSRLRRRGDCDILVLTVEVGSGWRTDVVL